jgi:hypothetical protein
MNEKLGQCMEVIELLRDHLKDKHHTRLEWMIIALIAVEVRQSSQKFSCDVLFTWEFTKCHGISGQNYLLMMSIYELCNG